MELEKAEKAKLTRNHLLIKSCGFPYSVDRVTYDEGVKTLEPIRGVKTEAEGKAYLEKLRISGTVTSLKLH